MFDNYFFLQRLIEEIKNELSGLKFFKSVSQSRNELVTGFFNLSTEKFLIFTFQKLPPLLYLKDSFSFAKKNFAEFFELLNERELLNITIDEFERNVRFHFSDLTLIFLFRGNHSNAVLIYSNEIIVDSFKKPDEIVNKKFSELYPVSEIDKSFFYESDKFNSLFAENSENKKHLRILGNQIVEEIKFRATNSGCDYFSSFQEILNELKSSPLRIYGNGILSFVELRHLNSSFTLSENIFSDLSRVYFSIQKNEDIQSLKDKILKRLKNEYEIIFKKLQELRKPENFIDRTEELRLYGNLILINSNQIKKGQTNFVTEFEGKTYKIKLDPKKSVFANAEEYFEKAREEESRLKSLNLLIEKLEKEVEIIKEKIELVESSTDKKELMNFFDEQNQKAKEEEITKHFRHFVIDGKYDVYVGKDGKSNDLLTTQFARPDDLWFHARGVSGSHLIIRRANKKEKIPKNIIEKAASIAAFYSKAKHSKLVPVAYTEKKYVIKRKGMPPGTVQMQKENVVMVEPKNPEQISEVTDEKNN